ncbi:unnamed protein product [Polarella glacialis]|uniref:V-type proton ATPase proteolipid subunit n=1 Tax=Polarella glacialis TaxID=89957 RepID=A0A813G1U2_POLGL|nr:unnamed protein product [Polarella glacialis]
MAVYGASTLLAMQPCDPSSAFFGFMGVTSAIVFANMGAAYGTAKSGVGISSMGVMRHDMVMRSIIPVVMTGVLGIYSNRQTAMGAAAATTAATATATAAATRQPQKRKAASQSSGRGASASGDQEAVMSSSKKSKLSTLAKKRKNCEVLNGCPPLKKCRRSATAAVPSGVVN